MRGRSNSAFLETMIRKLRSLAKSFRPATSTITRRSMWMTIRGLLIPAPLSEAQVRQAQDLAIRTFQALECSGHGACRSVPGETHGTISC